MKIRRTAEQQLTKWKSSARRKPLVLRGARQVGKTWLLRHFGTTQYDQLAYFNFDEQPELRQFFAETKDIQRILRNLSLVNGREIRPHKTLIIFDEIQECKEALAALKYFNENAPDYHVASAGSLLGVAISDGRTFPVGQVDFIDLFPLSFLEFLSGINPQMHDYLQSIDQVSPIPDIFFSQLLEYYKSYFISGGMPEAVVVLHEDKEVESVQKILQNILNAYALDFSKHIGRPDILKVGYIWNSIPSQLARENRKFLYQAVRKGARAREYENAIEWLSRAGLVYKIHRATAPRLPLSSYRDLSAFKLYMIDVGLLRRFSLLTPSALSEGNRLLTEFKGALSENYILQSLIPQFESIPAYWTSGNRAEVDYLVQYENSIIPIEVKSSENIKGRSLNEYTKLHEPPLRIRFSLRNLEFREGLLNIPLFMADLTTRLIHLLPK
jgi:uncharacterized protein